MMRPTSKEVDAKIKQADTSNVKEVLQLSREVENADLWKIYGRESEAGKLLFKIFGKGPNSIKIDYPKPKVEKKPLPKDVTRVKSTIPPPSKTIIEYPAPKDYSKKLPKVHAVDLIPHRKLEPEIRKEIDEFYSKPQVPLNRGVDRKKMVNDLQAKFKDQRGALPKGAELPAVVDDDILEEIDEQELQRRALQKVPKKHLAYTYEKPKEEKKIVTSKKEGDEELDRLYAEIEQEIEERQQYLEEIDHLEEPKIKERVKREIIDRVAELQKIIKMMNRAE